MLVWDWARFPVVRSQTQRVPTAVQESNDAESLYLFDALAGSRYAHSVERRQFKAQSLLPSCPSDGSLVEIGDGHLRPQSIESDVPDL